MIEAAKIFLYVFLGIACFFFILVFISYFLDGEQDEDYCSDCVNRKGCINCENGELKETEEKE